VSYKPPEKSATATAAAAAAGAEAKSPLSDGTKLTRTQVGKLAQDSVDRYRRLMMENYAKSHPNASEEESQADVLATIAHIHMPGKSWKETVKLTHAYFMHAMDKTKGGSVTMLEFRAMFPSTHAELFTYTPHVPKARSVLLGRIRKLNVSKILHTKKRRKRRSSTGGGGSGAKQAAMLAATST
jgi:hypothetical protein